MGSVLSDHYRLQELNSDHQPWWQVLFSNEPSYQQDISACSSGWPGSHYATQDDLELLILLPSPPKACGYRHDRLYCKRQAFKDHGHLHQNLHDLITSQSPICKYHHHTEIRISTYELGEIQTYILKKQSCTVPLFSSVTKLVCIL